MVSGRKGYTCRGGHRRGLELSEPEEITRPSGRSRLLEAECFQWEIEIPGRRNNAGKKEGHRVKKDFSAFKEDLLGCN